MEILRHHPRPAQIGSGIHRVFLITNCVPVSKEKRTIKNLGSRGSPEMFSNSNATYVCSFLVDNQDVLHR